MNGDQRLIKALAHALRWDILRILEQQAASPNTMAKLLEEPLANVSYHTKVLLETDCIELVETIPRRGALEHIYKLKPWGPIGATSWKEIPPALRTHFSGNALAAFMDRAVEALEAGTVESREGSGITWLPLKVDQQGWKELQRVLGNTQKRFRAIGNKSEERMGGSGNGIPVIVGGAAFEIASRNDADPS